MLSILVANRQRAVPANPARLRKAARAVLADAGITAAELSIAIVDDPTIHELNRQFLAHDYATDVLSFLLERDGDRLEGEIIASADTAARFAQRYGWTPADELLLYIIHGTLHLVGHDDDTPANRRAMRAAENRHLAAFALKRPKLRARR